MKWLAVAVLSMTLLGCRADQEREAAKCKLGAQKTYPNVTNFYMSAPAGEFIELCMRAVGYAFDNSNRNCTFPSYVVSEKPNPYCYVPDTEWGRIGQQIENWLRGDRKLSN